MTLSIRSLQRKSWKRGTANRNKINLNGTGLWGVKQNYNINYVKK